MPEKVRLRGGRQSVEVSPQHNVRLRGGVPRDGSQQQPIAPPWEKTETDQQREASSQPQQEKKGGFFRGIWRALNEQKVETMVMPPPPEDLPPSYITQYEKRQEALLRETQALDVRQNDQFLLEQAGRSPELRNLLNTVGPKRFLEQVRGERMSSVPENAVAINRTVFGTNIQSAHQGRGAFRGEFMRQGEVNLSDGTIYTYVDAYGETWQFTFVLGQARNAEQYDLEVSNGARWIQNVHYGIHNIGRQMTGAEIDALAHLFVSKVYEQDRVLTDRDLMDCLHQVGSYAQVIKHTDNLAGNPGIRASLARRAFDEGTAGHFTSIMPAAIGANAAIPQLEAALARVESGKGSWSDIDLAYSCITALQNGPGNLYHEGHLDPFITQFQAIVAANDLQDKYSPLTTQAEIDARPVSTDPSDYIDGATWNAMMGHK